MIETLFWVIVGWYIGYRISKAIEEFKEEKESNRIQTTLNEVEEQVNKMIVPLHVRSENGIFYAYHAEDEVFVAQGTDLDMLRINFEANLPKKHGVIVSSDANSLPHVKEYLERKHGKTVTWREAND